MIKERLENIFKDIFGDLEIELTSETGSNDLENWDSFTQILLIEAVEKEFDISIDMDDVFKLVTFGAFEEYIEGKLK